MCVIDFVLSSHQTLTRKREKSQLKYQLQKYQTQFETRGWPSLMPGVSSVWKCIIICKQSAVIKVLTIYDFISIEETCWKGMTMLCTAFVWPPLKTPSAEEMIFHFSNEVTKHLRQQSDAYIASTEDFFFSFWGIPSLPFHKLL